jgi:hypothetical protein
MYEAVSRLLFEVQAALLGAGAACWAYDAVLSCVMSCERQVLVQRENSTAQQQVG